MTNEALIVPGLMWGPWCSGTRGLGGEFNVWDAVRQIGQTLINLIPSGEDVSSGTETEDGTRNLPPDSGVRTGTGESFFAKKVNIFGQEIPMWIILLAIAFILLRK